MKKLLVFVAGVIAGVVGTFIYQVWGRPALPTCDDNEITRPIKLRGQK